MGENVDITIVVTETDENTTEQDDKNMALNAAPLTAKKADSNVELNLNLDQVKVQYQNAQISLNGVTNQGSDLSLEDAVVENLGNKNLRITLECGESLEVNAEKLIARLIKATDIPLVQE